VSTRIDHEIMELYECCMRQCFRRSKLYFCHIFLFTESQIIANWRILLLFVFLQPSITVSTSILLWKRHIRTMETLQSPPTFSITLISIRRGLY